MKAEPNRIIIKEIYINDFKAVSTRRVMTENERICQNTDILKKIIFMLEAFPDLKA